MSRCPLQGRVPVPVSLDQSSQSLHVTVQPTETSLTSCLHCKISPRLLCKQVSLHVDPSPGVTPNLVTSSKGLPFRTVLSYYLVFRC